MPVPSDIDDLDTSAIANSPQGTDPAKGTIDNYIRSLSAFIAQLRDSISSYAGSSGASQIGFIHSLVGSIFRSLQAKGRDEVNSKDMGVMSDGVTDDRLALYNAMVRCAAANRVLVLEDGITTCSDWIPLPDKLKMRCKSNARLKLTANTSLGGFVCGGYDISLTPVPFTDVEIDGLILDCNNLAGENGFNAINAVNVRLRNPQIYNTRHSTVTLGGRAFQFEGAIVNGMHIFSPYIENCSIGINSQGAASGAEIVTNINYHNVVMKNVDVPFNVDSQFANPETNTPYTMSTNVYGATLYDCGKLTFPGASSTTGGGIVCGDRGYGLRISNMRIVNSVAYGGIGGITRGVMFGVQLHNVEFYGPSMTAVFDFSQVGFGSSSAGTFASTVFTSGRISINSNLDYVVKAGPSSGRIGAACFRGIEINGAAASLTGLMDANAGTATTAQLEVVLSDQTFKTTGLRSLKSLFDRGNTTTLCIAEGDDEKGNWTPIDTSGAGLVFTVVAGTATYIRRSGWVTAKAQLIYPATASGANAALGGLPYAAINLGSFAGAGTIAYKTESTLTGIYVVGNTTTMVLSTATGGVITNTTLSGDTIYFSVTYQSV